MSTGTDKEPGKEITRYVDAAMYDAQPMLREEGLRISPRVFLLNATPDPLGALAVDMRMYRGDPVYSMDEITDEQREWAWEELSKTHLNTPLEGVQMKFMIEAVTRSFTHQMVRQRVGAYYVQESLRFAVKKGIAQECALPPSIISPALTDEEAFAERLHPVKGEEASQVWYDTITAIEEAYGKLISLGIPAEDARGLLPHCVTTRLLYNTNLRALFEHAGNRLCTQAQFEWRAVFMGIMKAMRGYSSYQDHLAYIEQAGALDDAWQWELIATPRPKTFAPICYKTGKCEFMSQLDRGCSIRDRVEFNHRMGIEPHQWTDPVMVETPTGPQVSTPIDPVEWMTDPWAGITTEDNRPQ